ncbi:MAG: TauD/TfdA family dioxygenase [Alphaproteobacteria bacterium]|nr:TauD/TfdA family dioxygenase [Alphaproteobacteria bacterium]
MSIKIAKIAGALGAEVRGLDLTREQTRAEILELQRALAEHLVVSVPDQAMTLDDLERLTDQLGGRAVTPFVKPLPDRPYVIRVLKEREDKLNFANAWHSDLSYLPQPPSFTLLYAHEVPDYGGDTLFQNQYLAYETLSDGLKATLRGLRAVHSAGAAYGTGGYLDRVKDKMSTEIVPSADAFQECVHPAVILHPETKRAALYLNAVYTMRFEGWSMAESQALLQHIYRHATNENLTCRVRWAKGTLTIWDNRATQHNALNDYHGQRREMFRTSVAGAAPVAA